MVGKRTFSSFLEAQLYKAVTGYVREEFNRAEALQVDWQDPRERCLSHLQCTS